MLAPIEHGRLRDADRELRAALVAKRRAGAGPVDLGRTLSNLAETALDLGNNDVSLARAGEAGGGRRAAGGARRAS